MRVTTAFNKMLAIEGATVAQVTFGPQGMVVDVRDRARRLRCPCGYSTRARYDSSTRRWPLCPSPILIRPGPGSLMKTGSMSWTVRSQERSTYGVRICLLPDRF
jgi:hypothetical protein